MLSWLLPLSAGGGLPEFPGPITINADSNQDGVNDIIGTRNRQGLGHVDKKQKPNHRTYIEVLRRMTPEQKLLKGCELNELAKALFRKGLRERFPDLTEEEFKQEYLERIAKCHNRSY
jgi:hypothetical protein